MLLILSPAKTFKEEGVKRFELSKQLPFELKTKELKFICLHVMFLRIILETVQYISCVKESLTAGVGILVIPHFLYTVFVIEGIINTNKE